MLDFNKRPLSWSAISSFEYNPQQWYETYILGKRTTSKAMEFGSVIDRRIQDDPTFMPLLPRYPHMQYKMKAVFNGIPLVGIPDGLSFDPHLLADYKTGKKKWDQNRADETGQLTMYLFMLYIMKKTTPEEFRCFIHWLPTAEQGDFSVSLVKDCVPITFETKRTMGDLLRFGGRINDTVKAMNDYVIHTHTYEKNHPHVMIPESSSGGRSLIR